MEKKDFANELDDDMRRQLEHYLDVNELQFVESNFEYQENYKQEETILEQYPKLRKLVDDREVVSLSKREIKNLIKILDIRDLRFKIAQELMFFRGAEEAYFYFKKINILKEDK